MRHVIVTRVSLLLTVLFLAAASVFAWRTTRADPLRRAVISTSPDSALFEKYCASCHTAADLRPYLRGLSDSGRRELEQFLSQHGEAPSEDDRRILDELAEEIPRSPE